MSGVLSSVGQVITFVIGFIGDIFGLFTTQPVLEIFLGLAVMSAIVSLVKSLIHRGGGGTSN